MIEDCDNADLLARLSYFPLYPKMQHKRILCGSYKLIFTPQPLRGVMGKSLSGLFLRNRKV